MSAIIEVNYFNSFWIKQLQGSSTYNDPKWPGLEWNPYGYPEFPISVDTTNTTDNFYAEEARIKGGFNNKMVSQGVRAYLNEKNPIQDTRQSSLIYSGVYNSRTDINRTNVFSVAEDITRDLDPANGSIQKLYAENTNLIIFQENKVSYSLINKNTIYSGTQGSAESTKIPVIGQNVPYSGTFGIGKNPESFAKFGFRKYFADPVRGSVIRVSMDGLTEISEYGMKDFFRDSLSSLDNNYKSKNLPWTLVTNPPRSIISGINLFSVDLDLSLYTFIALGTVSPIDVTSDGIGVGAQVTVFTTSQSVVQVQTTLIGGSGYRVGDTITIPGDNIKFSGSISFVLTSSMLSSVTSFQNPFYIESSVTDICKVFLGSSVLNLNSSGSVIKTGASVTGISKVDGITPAIFSVSTNNNIIPESSGFFAYEYKSKIIGGWDNHNRYYTVSIQLEPAFVSSESFVTLSYSENVKGWVSTYSYKPGYLISLKGSYFSTYNNCVYEHYINNVTNDNFLNYYGIPVDCSIDFVVNSNPSTKKSFQTINYEGDNGWYISNLQGSVTRFTNSGLGFADASPIIKSYNEGLYVDPNSGYPQRYGFNRKENLYVANISNLSSASDEEIIPGNLLSGIKGYVANVQIRVDTSTNVGGPKELWSVGTTFVQSS